MQSELLGMYVQKVTSAGSIVGKNGDSAPLDSGTLHTGWMYAPVADGPGQGVLAVAQINSDFAGIKGGPEIAKRLTEVYLGLL